MTAVFSDCGTYRYALWRDTKGQGEFFADLARCASEQAGQPLDFNS